MYPYIRMFAQLWTFRHASALPMTGTHVSRHMCLPWDIDPWMELNNGRTLTLYDLGRIPMAIRMGFKQVARDKGWGLTVAGNSTRYRRRVRMFDRFEMRSTVIGWDDRFIYISQSMWRGEECTSQMLLRSAIVGKTGMVAPSEVLRALGQPEPSPPLPDWVQGWIAADAQRPWPPLA